MNLKKYAWWHLNNYNYDLPPELIAQHPADKRDESRLLVFRKQQNSIQHKVFKDIADIIQANDILVVNDCRVIPARLKGPRIDTGTKIEILLTHQTGPTTWQAMVKPGRSCKVDVEIQMGDVKIKVLAIEADGQRLVEFLCTPEKMCAIIDETGIIPLPPYIERLGDKSSAQDIERYQTVYAKDGQAVAAPTAGLHFTKDLLEKISSQGTLIERVRLDVGLGTFLPVKSDDIRQHDMHQEYCQITPKTAACLNQVRQSGGRIIAVGTTSLRVLESCIDEHGFFQPYCGNTDIFIHPPQRVNSIDGLITNYHLPKSTLLMLIASWIGEDQWRKVYAEAIKERYRFYSYGDSMLLLK